MPQSCYDPLHSSTTPNTLADGERNDAFTASANDSPVGNFFQIGWTISNEIPFSLSEEDVSLSQIAKRSMFSYSKRI